MPEVSLQDAQCSLQRFHPDVCTVERDAGQQRAVGVDNAFGFSRCAGGEQNQCRVIEIGASNGVQVCLRRGDRLRRADNRYRLAKLILERLPVGMLVWPETSSTPKRPHPLTHHLWLAPDEDLTGARFGLARRAGLYGAAVLGVPRRVWAAAFPHPEVGPRHAPSLAAKRESRGFQGERLGWKPKRGGEPAREFVEVVDFPRTKISPDEAIFTGEYTGSFARAKAYSPYQTYFLRRLAELSRRTARALCRSRSHRASTAQR